MPTVVVTGVAGSVGSKVAARLLADRGVERVVGIDRRPFQVDDPRFDSRVVDLSVPPGPGADPLDDAMAGAGVVVHLAWEASDDPGADASERAAADAANRRSLSRVLAAAGRAGVEAVVLLSSATVYGAWSDNKVPLTEDARIRPNPEFSFAVSKAEAERVLADWADDHPSVSVAVLRPAVTVGIGGRPLYQALGATGAPRSGDGSRPVQYLHVDDLASAVVLASERRLRGVYNVAPDGGIPEDQARALAGGVARVVLPARVATTVSALGWRLWRRGVPAEAGAYATHPWVVAPDRLKAAGWQPGYTSEEALVATDQRVHWDDLPPSRRQNYNLLLIAGVVSAAAGVAGVAATAFARRRARR